MRGKSKELDSDRADRAPFEARALRNREHAQRRATGFGQERWCRAASTDGSAYS